MCGVVGYVGQRSATEVLIPGLRRLEYRGYDSAGVALALEGRIEIQKAQGKLVNVEKLLADRPILSGSKCGIGHTRWATHGRASVENAHPHQTGPIVLVHNGIIENFQELRVELLAKGHRPVSETDSELFGFLILEELKKMGPRANLRDAARASFAWVRGECSVLVMSQDEPGVLVALRSGSPLVAALDPLGGVVIASDPQPLIAYSREIYFLEPGEMVVATGMGMDFFSIESGEALTPVPTKIDWSEDQLSKGGYPHYMLKEIFEQPTVVVDTLGEWVDRSKVGDFELFDRPATQLLRAAQSITLIACGTSWHAALMGRYWIEGIAGVAVSVELASEFRYRNPVVAAGTLVVALSQSGETADTLAAMREMKRRGVPTLGISNVRGCSLARVADSMFYTDAGVEIGVAATKTFLAQALVLYLISGYLGRTRAASDQNRHQALKKGYSDLIRVPHLLSQQLDEKSGLGQLIQSTVQKLSGACGFFFIGRGLCYPLALEGALKLKETAYDYAEGYAAGELKHGPIAMIDSGMVVVVLAPKDSWRDKTVSNLQEVKARGAIVVGVGDVHDGLLRGLCDHWIAMPTELEGFDPDLLPLFVTPIIQLLSYYRAVSLGTDVDQPRNLAKSVTVE